MAGLKNQAPESEKCRKNKYKRLYEGIGKQLSGVTAHAPNKI
jgi:hypothetical protein